MLKQFKIQDIADLDDGRIALTINNHIKKAVEDCQNRPGVEKNRSVSLSIEIIPAPQEDGLCEEVDVEIISGVKLPKSHSKPMSMGARMNGQLVFNAASPGDVNQGSLDQAGGGMEEPKIKEE